MIIVNYKKKYHDLTKNGVNHNNYKNNKMINHIAYHTIKVSLNWLVKLLARVIIIKNDIKKKNNCLKFQIIIYIKKKL